MNSSIIEAHKPIMLFPVTKKIKNKLRQIMKYTTYYQTF